MVHATTSLAYSKQPCAHLKVNILSQISYSLVMILEFSGVLEVQYKEIMITGNE